MSVPEALLDPPDSARWCSACHRYHEMPSECPYKSEEEPTAL